MVRAYCCRMWHTQKSSSSYCCSCGEESCTLYAIHKQWEKQGNEDEKNRRNTISTEKQAQEKNSSKKKSNSKKNKTEKKNRKKRRMNNWTERKREKMAARKKIEEIRYKEIPGTKKRKVRVLLWNSRKQQNAEKEATKIRVHKKKGQGVSRNGRINYKKKEEKKQETRKKHPAPEKLKKTNFRSKENQKKEKTNERNEIRPQIT